MVVFAGARTQDLMGLSIRLAGFEIRDTLGWIYGSGFPKSMDVSKAIDKAAGAEREVVGLRTYGDGQTYRGGESSGRSSGHMGNIVPREPSVDTAPATPEAERWEGWGTALKPAIEPIILARKPLDGTVAANVLAHGVGGLNIDACRVGTTVETWPKTRSFTSGISSGYTSGVEKGPTQSTGEAPAGRFPANVLLDEHAAAEMDKQSGWSKSPGTVTRGGKRQEAYGMGRQENMPAPNDSGGASRFFPVFKYQAKAPKKERPVIERPPMLQLRDDLTPEQVDHVRARLQEVGIEIE